MNPTLILERTSKAYVIRALSACVSLALIPFAIHRFLVGQYSLALLDGFMVAFMAFIYFYVQKTRNLDAASHVIAACFFLTEIITVSIKGETQLVWCYPATIGICYLIPIKRAMLLNLSGLVVVTCILWSTISAGHLAAFSVSLISMTVFTFVFALRNQIQKDQLETLTLKDPLTNTLNRRAFEVFLDEYDKAPPEQHKDQAMIVLDIDHFKEVNDEYGHVNGDKALIRLVKLLRTQLHHDEKVYRIGGEEFVIAPVNHKLQDAYDFADRMRKFIEHSNLLDNVPVTISIGVASYEHGQPARNWVKRADDALYSAKRNGRNCTEMAA